jgi:predicted DNA-binding transcriptional regulator AlpA
MKDNNTLFLTLGQCAARYNISVRHFRQLVDRGEMPKPFKLGRSVRWAVKTLEDFENSTARKNQKQTARNCRLTSS